MKDKVVPSSFSLASVTPINRETGLPIGRRIDVVKGSTLAIEGEGVSLDGGASLYSHQTEISARNGELSIGFGILTPEIIYLAYGSKATKNGSAAAEILNFANKAGTSILNADTGIASVSVKAGEESKIGFNKFIVEQASATTVNVYAVTDSNFEDGQAFSDEDVCMIAQGLTITQGAKTEIPGFGIELTGGAGVIALTEGDTATFEAKPGSDESWEVEIGAPSDNSPYFSAICYTEPDSQGRQLAITVHKLKSFGMGLPMERKAFAEYELKAKAHLDKSANGGRGSVCRIETVHKTLS